MSTLSPKLSQSAAHRPHLHKKMAPTAILFVSANIANVANLVFNMIFARLLGPEAFADLTFLLTLKLGVLCIFSAFQFAFAKHTAKLWFSKNRATHRPELETYASHIVRRSFWVALPVMFLALVFVESFARAFQFDDPMSLFVLITIIPVIFPMIVYRGLSQGRIDLPRMVGSIQGEWAIRLFGGVLLYMMGLGLVGVALAVVCSILSGCLLSMTKRDADNLRFGKKQISSNSPKLLIATTPFLALQFAQVLILDGDIMLAKANMGAEFSGYVAGLMLIQRIFFFAFLSFSALLIPVIAAKTAKENNQKNSDNIRRGRSDLILMITGVAGISFPALMFLALFPSWGAPLLLGNDFAPIARLGVIAGATGAFFTLTHLCVVYWLANGKTKIAWVLLFCAALQMIFLGQFSANDPELHIFTFVMLKLSLQAFICTAFLLYTFIRITNWTALKNTGRPQRQLKDVGTNK